jgi:serine phosphatase RsbU (regulator of sigma subunit)
MTVAIIGPGRSSVCYGSAGHPPILWRRARMGAVDRLGEAGGPALGIFGDAAYRQHQTVIEPGDVMLLTPTA